MAVGLTSQINAICWSLSRDVADIGSIFDGSYLPILLKMFRHWLILLMLVLLLLKIHNILFIVCLSYGHIDAPLEPLVDLECYQSHYEETQHTYYDIQFKVVLPDPAGLVGIADRKMVYPRCESAQGACLG